MTLLYRVESWTMSTSNPIKIIELKGGLKIKKMKFNFRKISAIVGSTLMATMTMGIAAAANYPAPFVSGGSANVAVVYGASALPQDMTEAGNIQKDLGLGVTGGGSGATGLGSESFQIERTGNMFNLGDNANAVRDTLRKDQMPNLLADGDYLDDDNTEFEFTQKIELSTNLALTHFRDSDLDNVPTIGIQLTSSGTEVLNYSMEFQTKPDFTAAKLETTTITLFGKEYFISDVGTAALTLLDSAVTTVLNQGESTTLTVDGTPYAVSIVAIDSTGVIFSVNGVNSNRLGTGDTYKTSGGAHIGVKDFQQAQFATDTAFADFSLGAGKLELTEGSEVELNDDTVEGLTVVASSMNDSAGKFAGVKLQWKTSDRAWVTPNHEIVLPGFEAFKVSMTEFVMPSSEVVKVQDSGTHIDLTVPLKGGSVTLPILYHNESTATIKGIGESDDRLLVTSNTNIVKFNSSQNHEWFVASWEGSTDAYSEVFKVLSVNADNETSITAVGSKTGYVVADGSSIVAGDIELQVDVDARVSNSDFNLTITNLASTGDGVMRRIYTTDGLRIYLPFEEANSTSKGGIDTDGGEGEAVGHNATSWFLFMDEQDKDQTLANGGQIRLTLTPRSADDDTIHVSAVTVNATTGATNDDTGFGTGSDPTLRIGSTDSYVGYVASDLASRIDWDKSGDEQTADVTYHGEESYGRIFLSSTDATVSSGTSIGGVMLVTDAEVASVASKNLVVVGGSCINTAAAALLGSSSPLCEGDFTAATGVGPGQFLIKHYSSGIAGNSFALLVAGYESDDTVNAVTYLTTQNVDTSEEYKGTSSTSADLVVA